MNIKSVFELSDETPQELLNELAEADIDVEDLGDDNDIEQRSKRTFGYASQNSDIFIENLIKSGFYGLRLIYDLEDKIYFFIAFESNQIKLADGTNTTFDSNNNDIRFDNGGELTNNDVLKNFVNQVEAYQSNHYGTFNRDNLVESYHKLPDSIKEKIKPISTKNLFRGADGTSYKSAISFTKNQDYAKMFGTYTFPFKVVKENKGLIDTKRLSALLSKMRIANEIGDDEGEVIVIEPIFSKDIIENIEKFRFDNGGLVAPNGKPSNLSPEQYKLVRTPAFKKWFGDWENSPETSSKVVDENGEPLPVYHGTASDFNIFKIGRTGGIFFTNNKNSAERFSIGDLKRLGENPKVIQCFLNIRKYYEKNTNDEILINEYFNDYFQDRPFISKLSQKNILKNKYNRYFMDLVSFGIVNEEPKQKLISYNYDGVIIDADNYSKSYIVFEPEQIKLADGSNTTFDGNNPDIRFMAGGNIDDVLDKMLQGQELSQEDKNKISLYQKHLLSGKNDNTFEYHRVSELNIADTNSEEHINKSQIVVQFESDQKIDVKYMLKKIALTLKKSNIDSVVGFGFKMLAYIGYFVKVNEYDIEKAMSVLKNIGFNVTINPYYNTLYFSNEIKDDIKFQKLSENPDIIILSNSEIYQKLNLTDAQSVTRLTKLLKNFGITSYFIMKNQLTITDKSKINDLINYLNSKGYNAIRFKKRR